MTNLDSYQWRLRLLGAFLDVQGGNSVTITEMKTGFAARYYRNGHDETPLFVLVEDPQLRAIAETLQGHRRTLFDDGPSAGRSAPLVVNGQYQNVFRALGWELDDLGAKHIALDECGDRIHLSFDSRDAATGKMIRKSASVGPAEREEILVDARRRRRIIH